MKTKKVATNKPVETTVDLVQSKIEDKIIPLKKAPTKYANTFSQKANEWMDSLYKQKQQLNRWEHRYTSSTENLYSKWKNDNKLLMNVGWYKMSS